MGMDIYGPYAKEGKDSNEKTARIAWLGRKVRPGKVGEEMTARKGRKRQLGKDGEVRTARKGREGQ